MRKLLLLIIPFYLFAVQNPYTQLNIDEKLTILTQHFLDEQLQSKLPPKPVKEKVKDLSPINQLQYERYYNYIQRVKAITEDREKEEKDLQSKYEADIWYYNNKVKTLRQYYSKTNNLLPLLNTSINKSFKVFFGKPTITKPEYDRLNKKIYAVVWAEDIYNRNNKFQKNIEIKMPQDIIERFLDMYRTAKITIRFDFDFYTDILMIKDTQINFEGIKYTADFVNKPKQSFKLKIKINNDIFQNIGEEIEKNDS